MPKSKFRSFLLQVINTWQLQVARYNYHLVDVVKSPDTSPKVYLEMFLKGPVPLIDLGLLDVQYNFWNHPRMDFDLGTFGFRLSICGKQKKILKTRTTPTYRDKCLISTTASSIAHLFHFYAYMCVCTVIAVADPGVRTPFFSGGHFFLSILLE